MSRWFAICGELSVVLPTFLTMTASCSTVAGNDCETSTNPPPCGIAYATWTNVDPGANGPATVTRRPLTAACGDEPCMMDARLAPLGRSNTNGAEWLTGARAV